MSTVQAKSPFLRYGDNKCLLAIVAGTSDETLICESSVRLSEALGALQIIIDSDHCDVTVESALFGVMRTIETAKGMIDALNTLG